MNLNYISWNVDPVIFTVLGISIRYYSVLFVGGLILCIYILGWIYKTENIPQEYLEKLSLFGIIGIFAGARLGHCIFYEPDYFLAHPVEMILPIQQLPEGGYKFIGYQGLASHGGALGLIIALIIYSSKTRQPLIKTLDMIAIVAPLGSCFIRLGNLMNSEIIGMPATKPWAFIFVREDNIPRHPAQLYEAFSYVLIFIVVILLYKHFRQSLQNGFFLGFSMTLIFVARFFIEFLKERQVAFEANMAIDMGQILSIPYIIAGLVFMIHGYIRTQRTAEPERG